jgi:hypothetical protein
MLEKFNLNPERLQSPLVTRRGQHRPHARTPLQRRCAAQPFQSRSRFFTRDGPHFPRVAVANWPRMKAAKKTWIPGSYSTLRLASTYSNALLERANSHARDDGQPKTYTLGRVTPYSEI